MSIYVDENNKSFRPKSDDDKSYCLAETRGTTIFAPGRQYMMRSALTTNICSSREVILDMV
jgi:hypothetical protein